MKRLLFTFLALILFIILQCQKLYAQDVNVLKGVIINPGVLDMPEYKSTKSVTIISAKDISKMSAASVEEVLGNIEGINNNARGGFGVQNDLGMRGSTFGQVLILIDNTRINEALTGHFNMYLPIALAEIGQIEVVRGPAASAYGANAVGGLIHIKTKNYLANQVQKNKELSSIGQILLGENNLRIVDAMLASKNEDVYIGASLNVKSSTGQIFQNPNYLRDSSLDKNYKTYFDIKNYAVFGSYFLNKKTKLFGRASINTRDFAAQYFYSNSTFDQSVEKVNTIWTQLGLQTEGQNYTSQIGINYKKLNDEFIFNPLFAKNNHTTNSVVAYAQQQRSLNKNVQLAFGLQSIFQKIRSTDRGNHNNNTHAVFVSANYDASRKINITASARGEYNTDYDFSFVPQLGINYRPNNNMVFRSSIGMAHRAPDFTERYVSNNLASLSAGRNLGNPNLQTENSITADVGFDYYTKKEKLFSASIFARKGNNLIDYVLTNSNQISTTVVLAPNTEYFYTQNIANALTYGAEINLQKQFKINEHSKLRLGANYTFIKTATENNEPSKYISNHPGHIVNLLVSYEAKYFDIMLSNNYRKRKAEINEATFGKIPADYFVSNAVLRLKPFKEKLNVVAKVLNIFDIRYQEILGAPMPQRWFAAGIDWEL